MAAEVYRVLGRATSSNVQALMWGAAELSVPVAREDWGEGFAPLDSPAFVAVSPMGRIPVLVAPDGAAIFETAATLRYLAARYGDNGFWPRDARARAQVDAWAEWAKHHVAGAFTGPVFWRAVRTPPGRRDAAAIARATGRLEADLARAEERLAHGFLCGGALTLADIQFGHVLFRYFDAGLAQAALPNLRAYYDRLMERPAYRKHVAISYDSLRDTL
ncbi:MAG: glutathione S-transferase family protein [Pseudomonadota bacterium]